jgi:hypothetical protein
MKLHAKFVKLESDRPTWTTLVKQQVAGLRYLADSRLFQGLVLDDRSRKYPDLTGYSEQVQIVEDITAFLAEGAFQRLALVEALAHEWEGKRIAIIMQKFKDRLDFKEGLSKPDLDLKTLLEPICFRT